MTVSQFFQYVELVPVFQIVIFLSELNNVATDF